MVKSVMKKKLKRYFVTTILPPLLLIFLASCVVVMIVSVPDRIGNAIKDFFTWEKDISKLSLEEQRDFFENNADFEDMEELQSTEVILKYIDLQISGALGIVKGDSIKTTKVDGVSGVGSISEIEIDYSDTTHPFTTPWQLMSAVDLSNANFGVKELSQEVLIFNKALQPMFEDKINSEFTSSIYETIRTESNIEVESTYYEIIEKELDLPGLDPIEWESSKKIGESFDSWTEEIVIKNSKPFLRYVDYFGGRLEYDIKYKEKKDKQKKDVDVLVDSDTESTVQTTATTIFTSTPYIDGVELDSNLSSLRDALYWSVPFNSRSMFVEIASRYPNMENMLPLIDVALSESSMYIDENYAERQYNFTYPKLISDTQDGYYREDIVNLAKSLQGLDYFWGGKYKKKDFNDNWGNFKLVTSPNSSMSGLHLRSGMDCSGFVQWAYHNAGLDIQGSTYNMISGGKLDRVSLDDLEPGDLGFYHDWSGSETGNHVGIYLGKIDGEHLFIHQGGPIWKDEEHPTGQVIISALNDDYNGYPPVRFKLFYKYNAEVLK